MYRTKVLILSNNDVSAALLKAIRRNALHARVVKTLEPALALLHKKTYRLLFIDTTGLDADFKDAVSRVLSIKSKIVIIGVIPRNRGVLYTKLINSGVFEVLQKPINPAVAQAAISRALYIIRLYIELERACPPASESSPLRPSPDGISDKDIEDLGLDQLIRKKLSILFSNHVPRKITDLNSLVMPIIEKSFIETALELSGNNQVKASLLLGINRNTLKAKMVKLGIKKQ